MNNDNNPNCLSQSLRKFLRTSASTSIHKNTLIYLHFLFSQTVLHIKDLLVILDFNVEIFCH